MRHLLYVENFEKPDVRYHRKELSRRMRNTLLLGFFSVALFGINEIDRMFRGRWNPNVDHFLLGNGTRIHTTQCAANGCSGPFGVPVTGRTALRDMQHRGYHACRLC